MWQITIQNPGSNDHLGIPNVEDCAAIASDGYECYFK